MNCYICLWGGSVIVRHYDEDIWNISLKAIKEWLEVKHDNLPRNTVDDNAAVVNMSSNNIYGHISD